MDRVVRRQVPLLFATLAATYANVIGISFAQAELQHDIGLSPAAYGLGASALLFGFLLCAIPSNLLMERFGARLTFGRVLLGMGAGSLALAFVASPAEFVAVRLLTGVLAAGLAPGLKLYVSYWFPAERRAQVFAALLLAPVVAGAVVGPLTAALLTTADGVAGLQGWQWLFIALAAPCFVLAFIAPARLDNRPEQAGWLTAAERQAVGDAVAREHREARQAPSRTIREALALPAVYRLAAIVAALGFTSATLVYFVPLALRGLGSGTSTIPLLSSIPYVVGGVATVMWSRRSDRARERPRHFAIACAVAATGLVGLAFAPGVALGVVAASVAVAGVLSAIPVFWPVPLSRLTGPAAALGIALLQVVQDLGSAIAPTVHGVALGRLGDLQWPLVGTAALLLAAAALLPGTESSRRRADRGC